MTTATFVGPSTCWVPDGVRGSYADEIADLAEMYGRPLDEAQRIAVDAMTSYGAGGSWLTLESVVKQPRQNGKSGGIITPIVFADLFLWDADRIAWSAHLFKTSREAFEDHQKLIDGCHYLSRRVRKIVQNNGEESIILTSGARLDYLARGRGSGRGLGGKHVVVDEALFFAQDQAGALLPILAARGNSRVTYGSSAAKAESGVLRALTQRGRNRDPELIFVEWAARGSWTDPGCRYGADCQHTLGTPGCSMDDETRWREANPAMAPGRITLSMMKSMRRTLAPLEFGREFLGWDEIGAEADHPIALHEWNELVRPDRPDGGDPAFFLDCSPGLRSTSIGVAVTGDGRPHIELADHRPGSEWVISRVKQLQSRYPNSSWAIETTGSVSALLPALKSECDLAPIMLTTTEMARGCGNLQQSVASHSVTHSDDPLFQIALQSAVKRDVGEGLWAWGRRKSAGDISPLVAVTGALWILADGLANPEPWGFFE